MTSEEQKKFSVEQWKFIIFSMIVYMFFYVTRKNLSMAQVEMFEDGVITKYAIGIILTVHGLLYGVSRFVNGFWADRLNGRIFMAIGLALTALMNFLFGCTSLTILFGVFWVINGWTLGMGFPACAKMLTHWIHPKELATKMAIWNTSHSFGAVLALGLCSLILGPLGLNWRWCFWVPAALAAAATVFCFFCVMDSPTEAGVPELEIEAEATDKPSSEITMADRRRLVYGNRVIWLVALANFFVYIVRFGFLDWGPTFLKQFKGIPVSKGGLMIIAFELAAVVGTIFAGWITDKAFKGRGVRTCVFCMLFAALFSFGFWILPNGGTELRYTVAEVNQPQASEVRALLKDFDENIVVKYQPSEKGATELVLYTVYTNEELTGANVDLNSIKNEKKRAREEKAIAKKTEKLQGYKDVESLFTAKLNEKYAGSQVALQSSNEPTPAPIWLVTLLLMGAGFFIYGPQALIGIVAANQATKEAAAMANGFTGIMGYASTIVSGIGIAFIQVHYGWGIALGSIAVFALIGMVLFAMAWNAKATGYKTDPTEEKLIEAAEENE
ncbi:MAG: MFS transporter [Thermoguttaceae bacterium]|nr:MFS transporter [Thermoguttaceae bacterium]